MKLLVIAGPYEADRIRRAAVTAGFETVAVEPGESLSGWIAGSRPDLIVMSPQIVNPDPAVAIGKVRTASRGRVPIFVVGEPGDEARLRPLADGFFARPVASAALAAQARLARLPGAPAAATSAGDAAAAAGAPSPPPRRATPKPTLGPPNLKPLMSQQTLHVPSASAPVPPMSRGRARGDDPLLDLSQSIDAMLDAEMRNVFRAVAPPPRRSGTPVGPPWSAPIPGARPAAQDLERTRMVPPEPEPVKPAAPAKPAAKPAAKSATKTAPMPAPRAPAPEPRIAVDEAAAAADEAADEAVKELRDESSQKTVEVPRHVVAAMIGAGAAGPAGRLAPVESGQLAENDVASLLARMYVDRLTGWLTFRSDGVEKAIVFENGAPVLAGSNLPGDRMGEMLARQGRLSAEQQSRSAEMLVSTGRRLGVVLVEMGVIKTNDLGPLVRQHYQEIIYSLFAWETGEWTLGPDRPEKEETVFLSEPAAKLIIEGIRRKYSAARLLAHLGGGQQLFRLRSGRETTELLEQMALTDEERAVVPLFDGVRTLEEVARLAAAGEQTVWALGWALNVLGQLEMIERTRAGNEAATRVAEQDGAANVPAVSRPDVLPDGEADRARVLARFALVQDGDYFQVLGVERDANVHEIRRAHQALAREFAATALAPQVAAQLEPQLSEIRIVLDEALLVLGDASLRQRYQRNVPPALATPASSAPPASSESTALSSD